MYRIIITVLIVLVLGVVPALAQDTSTNSVEFNGFGFDFESTYARNVNIEHYAGDPPENGPGFSDAPHTALTLYNDLMLPESLFDVEASIHVYRIADLAPYPFLAKQADALQSLLVERPDLGLFEIVGESAMADVLPYVPMLPHGQILNARVEFLETEAVRGIRYITYSNATPEPFLGNYFTYTFQGISTDGQFYVTVNLPLETRLFPSQPEPIDLEVFSKQWPEYLAQSIATLNAATPDDFSPSLTTLDMLVRTFRFGQ